MTLKLVAAHYNPISTFTYSTVHRYKYVLLSPDTPATFPHTTVPIGNPYADVQIAVAPFTGYLVVRDHVNDPFNSGYWWIGQLWWSGYVKTSLPLIPPMTTTVTKRSLKYLEVQNSSNTVGWLKPQGLRVGGLALTKSKPPINRPKKPVYFQPRVKRGARPIKKPPVVLLVNPPSRFPGEGVPAFQLRLDRWASAKKRREERLTRQADRRYNLQLEKYEVNHKRNLAKISDYDKRYQIAHKKYEDRLDKYLAAMRKSKDLSYSKAPISPAGTPKDNPYGRIKMTFTGPPLYYSVMGGGMWVGENLPFEDRWRYNETETWYRLVSLDDSLTPTELAQYAETTRKLIFAAINPELEEFDHKLRRKIHQKLKNQTVHIGNIIAERKQTMDLVQSTVKRILDLIKAKKNIFRSLATYAKNSKQIASDILAFKFGVEPLMNDIQSFAKYLDTDSDSPLVTVRVNTGNIKSLPLKVVTPMVTFAGFVEISYTIKCEVDNPATRLLSEFGLINPLEILWEVTPWSFVVDWFYPVGDWLSNKTSDCGLIFKTGTRKVRLVGSFTTREPLSNQPDPFGVPDIGTSVGPIFVDFDGELIDRSVLTSIPIQPTIRFKNPISWSHGIESVALAVQKLKIR